MLHESVSSRRRRKLLVAVATLSATTGACGLLPAVSAAALPLGCSQSGQIVTCTQTFTSGSDPFLVPSGVSSLRVKAVGGQGGGAGGAFGAVVTGELSVTSGATIYAVVGGNGTGGVNGSLPGSNGGGASGGGFLGSVLPPASINGAGGGASDVRTSADELSSRVLVAAGGGGGGGEAPNTGASPAPGSAGGGSGAYEDASTNAGGPGGAGSETSPECDNPVGQPIPCCELAPLVTCQPAVSGSAGVLGDGGAGGDGGLGNGIDGLLFAGLGGGGGGGGLFGGGGGGGALVGDGSGGGGGSNLVPTGGSASVDTTGVPMVQISYNLVLTIRAQCKNGGWRSFGGMFKNRRQCVAFVVKQARRSCVAERAKIGRQAFRNKYGLGRYRRHALLRCIDQATR